MRRVRGSQKQKKLKTPPRSAIFGRVLKPSLDPPSITSKPWNSAIIQLGGTKDQSVTISDIHKVALSQLGLLSAQTLEYRVFKVSVWGLSIQRPIRVEWFGFSANQTSPLAIREDWGAPNRLPRVGYKYPASVACYTYTYNGSAVLFKVDTGTTTNASIPWLAYVSIKYRSDVDSPISQSQRFQTVQQCAQEINQSSSTMGRKIKKHEDQEDELNDISSSFSQLDLEGGSCSSFSSRSNEASGRRRHKNECNESFSKLLSILQNDEEISRSLLKLVKSLNPK